MLHNVESEHHLRDLNEGEIFYLWTTNTLILHLALDWTSRTESVVGKDKMLILTSELPT